MMLLTTPTANCLRGLSSGEGPFDLDHTGVLCTFDTPRDVRNNEIVEVAFLLCSSSPLFSAWTRVSTMAVAPYFMFMCVGKVAAAAAAATTSSQPGAVRESTCILFFDFSYCYRFILQTPWPENTPHLHKNY
jgi:hypothetical protein